MWTSQHYYCWFFLELCTEFVWCRARHTCDGLHRFLPLNNGHSPHALGQEMVGPLHESCNLSKIILKLKKGCVMHSECPCKCISLCKCVLLELQAGSQNKHSQKTQDCKSGGQNSCNCKLLRIIVRSSLDLQQLRLLHLALRSLNTGSVWRSWIRIWSYWVWRPRTTLESYWNLEFVGIGHFKEVLKALFSGIYKLVSSSRYFGVVIGMTWVWTSAIGSKSPAFGSWCSMNISLFFLFIIALQTSICKQSISDNSKYMVNYILVNDIWCVHKQLDWELD